MRELDDRVYGYSPRWIESNGKLLPIHVRYAAYGTFIAVLVLASPFALGLWAGGVFSAPTVGLGVVFFAAYSTVFIMSKVEKDLSVRGVLETYRNELSARLATFRAARAERRESRSVVYKRGPRYGGSL